MMEWVLKGLEGVNVYVDDVIVGSTGDTLEAMLENHERVLRATLERLAESELRVDPNKVKLLMEEIEFRGHVLRDGRRRPSPAPPRRWCRSARSRRPARARRRSRPAGPARSR